MFRLHRMRRCLADLLDLLLPPACPLCGRQMAGNGICADCGRGIRPVLSPCCPRCALPYLTEDGEDHLCENCLRAPPPFAWVRPIGVYEDSLRQAVHHFKYRGAIDLDRILGRLLADALEEPLRSFRPDLIVPVPLHRSRLRERTYNQALLLARSLGRLLHLPVACRLLIRVRPTAPQQGLSARLRHENLKGAFRLTNSLSGEKILLVDDVLTTGATARECSRVLLQGGAGAAAVTVVGRAPREGHNSLQNQYI